MNRHYNAFYTLLSIRRRFCNHRLLFSERADLSCTLRVVTNRVTIHRIYRARESIVYPFPLSLRLLYLERAADLHREMVFLSLSLSRYRALFFF